MAHQLQLRSTGMQTPWPMHNQPASSFSSSPTRVSDMDLTCCYLLRGTHVNNGARTGVSWRTWVARMYSPGKVLSHPSLESQATCQTSPINRKQQQVACERTKGHRRERPETVLKVRVCFAALRPRVIRQRRPRSDPEQIYLQQAQSRPREGKGRPNEGTLEHV